MAPNGILLKWRHSTREEEVRQGEEVIPYMCGLVFLFDWVGRLKDVLPKNWGPNAKSLKIVSVMTAYLDVNSTLLFSVSRSLNILTWYNTGAHGFILAKQKHSPSLITFTKFSRSIADFVFRLYDIPIALLFSFNQFSDQRADNAECGLVTESL